MYVKRGQCLIINQIHYASTEGDDNNYDRTYSLQDEKDLVERWKSLGCDTHVERDLTKENIKTVLLRFREVVLKNTSPDYMVLIIMGHGRQNPKTKLDEIFDIKWKGVPTDIIIEMFVDSNKCPAMLKKTKLFYVQACRGKLIQKKWPPNSEDVAEEGDDFFKDGPNSYSPDMPNNEKQISWYHIVYSTTKGFISFGDKEKGTFFIQTLCEVLKEDGFRDDINSISSSVISRVMQTYKDIQAPVSVNQLGDKVYIGTNTSDLRILMSFLINLLLLVWNGFLKQCLVFASNFLCMSLMKVVPLVWNNFLKTCFVLTSKLLGILVLFYSIYNIILYLQGEDIKERCFCTLKCLIYRLGLIFESKNPCSVVDECVVLYQDKCCKATYAATKGGR